MHALRKSARHGAQAGFSMVELLMAAFILAIGMLGLAMLQTMSLRSSRGGQSLQYAVQIADRTMDQIEQEGRLSWLNITDTTLAVPTALTTLQYVGKGTTYLGFQETFNSSTNLVVISPVTSGPVAVAPTLSGSLRYVAKVVEGAPTAAGDGQESTYLVTVTFQDTVNQSGNPIVRSVQLSRSILHG